MAIAPGSDPLSRPLGSVIFSLPRPSSIGLGLGQSASNSRPQPRPRPLLPDSSRTASSASSVSRSGTRSRTPLPTPLGRPPPPPRVSQSGTRSRTPLPTPLLLDASALPVFSLSRSLSQIRHQGREGERGAPVSSAMEATPYLLHYGSKPFRRFYRLTSHSRHRKLFTNNPSYGWSESKKLVWSHIPLEHPATFDTLPWVLTRDTGDHHRGKEREREGTDLSWGRCNGRPKENTLFLIVHLFPALTHHQCPRCSPSTSPRSDLGTLGATSCVLQAMLRPSMAPS